MTSDAVAEDGRRSSPAITHGCGAQWRGLGRAHCAGCHRTFSADSAFDAHRRDGECVDPATAITTKGKPRFQLRQDSAGNPLWGWPGSWKPEPDEGTDTCNRPASEGNTP